MNFPPPLTPTSTPPREDPSAAKATVSPVGALATIGALFVVVAAISLAVSNRDQLGETVRAIGLALAALATSWAADRARRTAPMTALATAVVGAVMAFPAGVATMAWFGQAWPICLTVAAVATLPIAEWRRRGWSALWFDVVQVLAVSAGSFGVAALCGLPAGLIAIAAALVAVWTGANWRAIALAGLSVTAPVLGLLANQEIGAGTLARAGVVGAPLGWAGPLVGLLAALVLVIAGRRVDRRWVQAMAPVAAAIGMVTGLTEIDAPAAAWASLPAVGLFALAALAAQMEVVAIRSPKVFPLVEACVLTYGVIMGVIGWVATWVVLVTTTDVDESFALTAIVWMLGLTALWRVIDVRDASSDLLLITAAVLPTALAALIVEPHSSAEVGVAVIALVGAVVAIWLGASLVASGGGLVISMTAILTVDVGSTQRFVLLAGWVVAAALALGIGRPAPRWWSVTGFGVWAALAGAALGGDSTTSTPAVATVIGFAIAVWLIAPTGRQLIWLPVAVVMAPVLAIWRIDGAESLGLCVAFTAVAATAVYSSRHDIGSVHPTMVRAIGGFAAASSVIVGTGLVELTRAGFQSLGMISLVALSGIAWTLPRRSYPVLGAAVAWTWVLAVTVSLSAIWVAGTWSIIGVAISLFGLRWRQPAAVVVGAVTAAVSAIRWLYLLDVIDISTKDLVGMTCLIGGLVAGELVVARSSVSSWVAFAPGFILGGGWLLTTQWTLQPVWALPLAVTVGVASMIGGASRKIIAPLVGGATLAVGGIVVASWERLAGLPGWAWVGVGGATLLLAALRLERIGGSWAELRRQALDVHDRWR